MIACAAIQRLERYGSLGLKRHSVEDFVSTSLKDARRANIYALTLLSTWREAVQAVRGGDADSISDTSKAPARYTEALVYAVSFAVALTTQHLFEVNTNVATAPVISMNDSTVLTAAGSGQQAKKAAAESVSTSSSSSSNSKDGATAASLIFTVPYAQALELLTLLKEMTVAIGSSRALRSNASSDDFTKAVAHLLTSSTDLALLLLSDVSIGSNAATPERGELQPGSISNEEQQRKAILAQVLVLVTATAQMLRRVQVSYPISHLYHTRPCAALLKIVANKHKQLEQRHRHTSGNSEATTEKPQRATNDAVNRAGEGAAVHEVSTTRVPVLLSLLRRYIQVSARCSLAGTQQPSPTSSCAASLFSIFSLFQRLSMLHGALGAIADLSKGLAAQLSRACDDVQYWLSQLLSSTACNRATRYVVYFREDELRLMQHNVRQASEYALFTFATTPPADPGLVESLLAGDAAGNTRAIDAYEEVTHARAALVLAQWCVSAPFYFESFCRNESWASFAQEQRRLVLRQQSRARRGLERTSHRQQRKERARQKALLLDEAPGDGPPSVSSGASSVHSGGSDSASSTGGYHQRQRRGVSRDDETASLSSFQTARHVDHADASVGGSLTSLASRVSLLSTFSKHSTASYLSFISVLRPSAAADSVAGGAGARDGTDGDGEGAVSDTARQMHESEDGNTNLPLILLEQLTLGLHRFMEAYPAELLDRYGLRSVSWNSIARMFAIVEASLANNAQMTAGTAAAAAARRHTNRHHSSQEQQQPLFNLAQDIRYNKGMGYECLGLLFAKVVAPLLDLTPSQQQLPRGPTHEVSGANDGESGDVGSSSSSIGGNSNGNRTKEELFANATVGSAVLTLHDDPATRASVEAALSTCLTAYEKVAPQVVDMSLSTILRLASRTAITSAGMATPPRHAPLISSLSSMLVAFVRDITARLGRSNDLPRLVDALLEQRDFAANADAAAAVSAAMDGSGDTASSIRSLRAMFSHPSVRQAVMAAAGTSLDPESLLGRLSSVAAELVEARNGKISSGAQDEEQGEAASTATSPWTHDDAQVQRMLLALELMEALLAGVVPTSVSASALLEHAAQLELLLSASFMTAVEELQRVNPAAAAARDSGTRARDLNGDLLHDRRLLMIQHIYTIRQCRAVTILCLQDLGTQHVHDYLRMLEDVLWQLTSHVGNLVGSLTLAELQPLLQAHPEWYNNSEVVAPSPSVPGQLQLELLPPSLILQRLSLARTVTVALGTHAGPEAELRDMVAHLWDCLGNDRLDTAAKAHLRPAGVSLWLANQMTSEEWVSLVALGKEKDARASMMELLLRSAAVSSAERTETPAWLSRCLQCIPATVTRALVDALVSLPVEDLCDTFCESAALSARQRRELVRRQWMVLTASLVAAYAVVGHNPYWPSVVAHTVCAVTHVARVWRKYAKGRLGDADGTPAQAPHRSTEMHSFALLMRQLLSVLLCTLRSEPRAAGVLRRVLLTLARESAVASSSAARPTAPALSRCGMSVAYVEALKVPATSLSDLSAPAPLTASTLTTAVNEGEEDEVFVALKDMTFEDELRGVGIQLFAPAFVKRLLTLTGLCSDSTAVAMPLTFATAAAVISASMSTLALLYQICVAAAQASWRARTTDGNLEALMQTPAVVFLHAVASGFHARGAAIASSNGVSTGAAATVALTAFLEQFNGHDGAPAEHRLFVHIASAATTAPGEKRRQVRDTTDGGAGDVANGATVSSAPRAAAVASSDALEAVEKLWCDQLRSIACTVMHLSHTAEGECNASAAVLQKACVTFRQLFTCMWSSARSKQHQMSKGSGSCIGGGSGGGSKRVRSHGDNEPTVHHSSLSGGVDAFLAEVLALSRTTGDDGSDAVGGVTGNNLRCQLADFFGITATATKGAARSDVHVGRVCDGLWMRLLSAGEEAGVCALWLLWKLQCVSAALRDDSATTEGLQDDSQARMRKFLCAYCDMNACVEGDAAAAWTASTYTRVATMLRALPNTLRVLTAEGVPPLFHEHVNSLLTSTIPRASPRSSADASSFAVAAPAAAELLVHLLSVRPRLPAEMLLPHAQHLLVWLSSPSSSAASLAAVGTHGGTSPSLSSLCIRVCAAVAAHPAVSSASDASALIASWASQQQLIACRGVRHPRVNSSAAQELLDNVWLVLLSLLEGSRAPHCAEASTTPLLREGELVQLILLLTKTWLGHSAHQQVLWSRPAMLPPLMCALFTCVMRGMESQEFSPRVLNVLASGLAAMAAHVDAATANEGDADVDSIEGADDDAEGVDEESPEESGSVVPATPGDGRRRKQTRRLEGGTRRWAKATTVPAHVKRAALAAATSALFEVAHHYIHIFTAFSSDMDFLFTDFLKVLSQHFLPAVTRPPIAHHVGVRIGGTARSEMTFADLAYMCVGNAESKSLLKQAALRMEEAGVLDSSSASDGITAKAKAEPTLTDGSRSIFRVA
nr:unnamed protein product [Leishmania braziliensis]